MTQNQDVHAWDLVITSDNRREAEAAIAGEAPRWDRATDPSRWQTHVPSDTRERWSVLTEAEREKVVGDAVLAVMDRVFEGF